MKRNIGILGGTFNPVHRGHVELGLQARRLFHLDRVVFVLSARPPHKPDEAVVPAGKRLELLQAALAPYPGLEASDMEMRRPGRSYSIDTVTLLQHRSPDDCFFFLSGSEGFLKIHTWKQWRRLLRRVVFLVALRKPGHLEQIAALMRAEKVPLRRYPCLFSAAPGVNVFHYASPTLEYSSTRVRSRLRGGESVADMLDPAVTNLVEEKGLYGE